MTKDEWIDLWYDMVRSAANVGCLYLLEEDDIIEDDDDFFNDLYYDDLYGEYL